MDSWCPILFSGLSSATIFYLMLKLSLIWPVKTPSYWRVLLPCSHHPLSPSLLSAVTKCSRFMFYFPAPAPDLAVSTRSPGSWKLNWLRGSQDLSVKQACHYWGVPASRPICIPTHTYSFTTIFISISTYANCKPGVHTGPFLPTQHRRVHSAFFPSAFPTMWNLASTILVYFLIWPIPLHNQPVVSTATLPPTGVHPSPYSGCDLP